MENYQDLIDLTRSAEVAKKDYEFAELMGEDHAEDIAGCERIIAEARERLEPMLREIEMEDSNRMQLALIVQWAKKERVDPEKFGSRWIHLYSANFRRLWDNRVRDFASLSVQVYRF